MSLGSPAVSTASRMISASAVLEWIASLPPRRMTTFPAFRQRVAASTVTLGRDSKIMPMTPSGTRVLRICKPLGRTEPPSTEPMGSSAAISWRAAFAMPEMRAGVSRSRSCSDSVMWFCTAASKSLALAARISSCLASRASAMAARALFLTWGAAVAMADSTAFALTPRVSA